MLRTPALDPGTARSRDFRPMSHAPSALQQNELPSASPLARRTDLHAQAVVFAHDGHALLPDLLEPDCAQRWLAGIAAWREWALVTRVQGRHRSFDAAAMDAIPHARRAELDALIAAEARAGFQYLYERYPLDTLARGGHLHDALMREMHALLRAPAFLDLARTLTGEAGITFADGQVTRYRAGHFLTLHDDHAEDRERIAAFVLNLTPRWGADYGGQLQFVDAQGRVEHSLVPRFNALVVFRVPRPHLVSAVAPFVADSRYAITGWFHTGAEPVIAASHGAAQR
jgi:SM-20-related protein